MSSHFDALKAALQAAGVDVDGLELKDFENYGRGLATTVPRAVGDVLLRLPINCCLTDRTEDVPERLQQIYRWLDTLLQDPSSAEASSFGPEAEDLRLVLRIWCEDQQPSSEIFAAWMPILRSGVDLSGFAHRWGEEAILACGPLSTVPHRLGVVQEEYRTTCNQVVAVAKRFPQALGSEPSVEDLEWFHFLCRSRAYPFRPEVGSPFNAICPIADLANHDFVQDATPAQRQLKFAAPGGIDAIIVRAVEDYAPGSQILYEYTAATNDELACNFGFVLQRNKVQQVPLSIAFPAISEKQMSMLKGLRIGDYVRTGADGKCSVQLILRDSDPFPNIIIVLMRVLLHKGDLDDPQRFLKGVSSDTKDMDSPWMPTLLSALQANLKLYPMRDTSNPLPQDIVYQSTREVLKKSMERLLTLMKQRDAPPVTDIAAAALAAASGPIIE